jgi:hypothetical protein
LVDLYSESLKDAGGNLTEETVSRHSQLVGHLGKKLDKFFSTNVSNVDEKQKIVSHSRDFGHDLELFINMLTKEKLFNYTPARAFKSFQTFQFSAGPKDPARLDRLPKIQ